MASVRGGGPSWQVPKWTVRVRLAAPERIEFRSLFDARAALASLRVSDFSFVEVREGPDLLLLVGATDWVESQLLNFRSTGDLTPAIALNINAETGSVAHILEAGADDCMACPFDSSEFRARVQALMRRVGPVHVPPNEIAADRTTLCVRVRDVEARISRKQFEIFVLLAGRRERWVHSDEIIGTICGTHHDPATSLVRVQIHALRKALGDARGCIRCDGHKSYMLTLMNS